MTFDNRFKVYEISPLFTLQVHESKHDLPIPSQYQEIIERIWSLEFEKSHGLLFNGKILSFVSLTEERLIGKFVDFKYYLAQHVEQSLKPILQIEAIGVSGITTVNDKILCGHRSPFVTTFPNQIELVPSGGVDLKFVNEGVVDLGRQLISELEEEAGISQEHIARLLPFALIHDSIAGGFDICMRMELHHEAIEKTLFSSEEYEILSWISKKALTSICRNNENIEGLLSNDLSIKDKKLLLQMSKNEFVPLSKYLIGHFLVQK